MLGEALAPYGGIVMWRAFVYSPTSPDRANQAVEEFLPLDGKFADNVIVQIKNGPIDFQPREPFSPLFGKLHDTQMMMEFQITQEYLGFSHHMAYHGTTWEECFDADTYRDGAGSTVARTVMAVAGVANTGQDPNLCGYVFAQANWYAFGRLAWNPELDAEAIADEWIRQTFLRPDGMSEAAFSARFVAPVRDMLMASREAVVNYAGRRPTTTRPTPRASASTAPAAVPTTSTSITNPSPPPSTTRPPARKSCCSGSTTCRGTIR